MSKKRDSIAFKDLFATMMKIDLAPQDIYLRLLLKALEKQS